MLLWRVTLCVIQDEASDTQAKPVYLYRKNAKQKTILSILSFLFAVFDQLS
jgi:hypothetical protein